jgi:hypothetical protein
LERISVHLEFHPADAPDPDDPDVQLNVAPERITMELLALCEEFIRQASPIVHGEMRQFLTQHGHPGGLGWFLDALGSSSLDRTTLPSMTTSAAHPL